MSGARLPWALPWVLTGILATGIPFLWAPVRRPAAPLIPPEDLVIGQTEPEPVRPPPTRRPDVLLILTCSLARDFLQPYGAPAPATPHLARLATAGVVFEDAIAAGAWTVPAAAALLTGEYPPMIGLVDGSPREERVLPEQVTTLAERLWGLGYETIGVAATEDLVLRHGFAAGFDTYLGLDPATGEEKLAGSEVVAVTRGMVSRRSYPDRPLFAQVQLADTHTPRRASPEEIDLWDDDELGRKVAVYRAEVARLDHAVGALVNDFRARLLGTGRGVLVLVVGDHGEGLRIFPNHRGHGRTLYESVIRVPWIVAGPGVAPGRRIDGVVSGIDVLPTVLGLIGAPDPTLLGRDWSALVQGGGELADREVAFAGTWYEDEARVGAWTSTRACVADMNPEDGADELFTEGCFLRRGDPGFLTPVPAPSVRRELYRWYADMEAQRVAWEGRRQ